MIKVSISELRKDLSDFLLIAQLGTEIAVTSRNKIIARIVPPADSKSRALEQLKKLRETCKVGEIVQNT